MFRHFKNKDFIFPAINIFFIILLYYKVLWFNEYTNWDTPVYIINNNYIQNISFDNIIAILTPGTIQREVLFIPVTYLSYMFEVGIWGINMIAMHIDNVILHAANMLLIYYLVKKLFKNSTAAFFSSLIFAIHPLQVEAVTWPMGRKDLLMTFFSLLSIIYYLKDNKESNRNLIFSIVFFILACLSKPTALVLSSILFLTDLFFGEKESIRNKIITVIPFIICCLIIYYINTLVPEIIESLTEFKTKPVFYLPKIYFDWCYRFFLFNKCEIIYSIPKSAPYFQFNIFFALTLLIIIAVAIYGFFRQSGKMLFCILFTFSAFVPTFSTLLSNRSIVTADRYGYFPMIGIYILFGILIAEKEIRIIKILKYGITTIWITGMLIADNSLIPAWSSIKALWEYELSVDKNSFVGYHNMATYYYDCGKVDLSLEYLLKAEKNLKHKTTLFNIAEIYREKNNIDKAIEYYKKAIKEDPDNPDYHGVLGSMYLREKMQQKALKEFIKVTELNPEEPKAYYCIQKIYADMGDVDKANAIYRIYKYNKKMLDKK